MFYLIQNQKVVDKAQEPFPVHRNLQWVESREDFPINGKVFYQDGAFVDESKKDADKALLAAKGIKKSEVREKCLDMLLIGDLTYKTLYPAALKAIENAKDVKDLQAIRLPR